MKKNEGKNISSRRMKRGVKYEEKMTEKSEF